MNENQKKTTDEYRNNYDAIFGKKIKQEESDVKEVNDDDTQTD